YSDNMAMAASVLERFGTEETIAFFASLGLMVRERRGYLYPVSEQAAVVLDVLRYGLEREGITVLTQAFVKEIAPMRRDEPDILRRQARRIKDSACQGYLLRLHNKDNIWAKRVILACGGQAAPKTGSDGSGYELARFLGHHVIPPVPSLVQLHCGEKYCKALAGVRAEGVVRICLDEDSKADSLQDCICREAGEIQFTEYGISGIPVFQLSGSVNQLLAQERKLRAEIDFFPQYEEKDYEQLCRQRLENLKGQTVETFFTGMLHKKIMNVCIRQAGLASEQKADGADRQRLRQVFALCRRLPFTITGSHPFDSAQVCRGGVSLQEVDSLLQSKCSPGLYLAGELLNVDGRCGGYNLQWPGPAGILRERRQDWPVRRRKGSKF
ncbi:MAG: aminoacetone oxidase family FAD-binding enzyme, partial [Acetatifactor sp.]|nr:aminoacetone oxidase family FAD-binding enzyme [Acetatifactor sp.]